MKFLKIDSMIIKILTVVLLASFIPLKGNFINLFKYLTIVAISVLFFMHGAKLSRKKIILGSSNWQLHLWILCSTFILFPLIGFILICCHLMNISPEIDKGFLYLCSMPSTVQSAIALTSIAGGNIAASICSASASSILGIFLSPLIVKLILGVNSSGLNIDNEMQQVCKIILQLLIPFLAGHISRNWIYKWIDQNNDLINKVDQISILLVVYSAFSEAVTNGIWNIVGIHTLLWILIDCMILLFFILIINYLVARVFKFNRSDEIVLLFCGSKKSLASGVPMANILFPVSSVGIVILPLMIFHQVQLMTCSYIAQCYKQNNEKT
ncbi:bile acid:sodium symporter family protein [Pantoea sp. SoEX]|uniref:bile acid:sodium symporter family protein n=1 Tax=Pantoea sp. SoEX TaxID=2576763 RepID=UPI001357CBA0|nr:bile acid:sodium symporter family protein [Pantoea sp. SoEX]MXP50857.1 bile acid:sodium symporter [Pantoea sp. SoEX]